MIELAVAIVARPAGGSVARLIEDLRAESERRAAVYRCRQV
jgi:hypothetical protein